MHCCLSGFPGAQHQRQIHRRAAVHFDMCAQHAGMAIEIAPDEAILVVDQCQEQPLLHQGAVAVAPSAVVGVGWVDYQRVAEAVTGRIGAAEGDGRRLQVW